MNTKMNVEKNFARAIKMLILSVTFMGGAVLTPLLTEPTHAQANGGAHVRVFNGGYVAMSETTEQEEMEVVADEGSAPEEDDTASNQPEYKYISIRRF